MIAVNADVSTRDSISPKGFALIADPCEEKHVYVAKSQVSENAGEGLFARVPIRKNQMCEGSYSSGKLVSPSCTSN